MFDATLNNVEGNQTFIECLKYTIVKMFSFSIVFETIGCYVVVVLATMGCCNYRLLDFSCSCNDMLLYCFQF